MKFTKEIVDDLANKLLIGLNEEENNLALEEFKVIDDNMNKILAIPDIYKVEPMTHALDEYIVDLSDDEYEDSVSKEELFQNCVDVCGDEVKVPKVVG